MPLLKNTPIFLPEQEAILFGSYLLKKKPNNFVTAQYVHVIARLSLDITLRDKKILAFIYRHTWSIGLIDSGLALIMRESEIRRRLFIMFSILECSTEYVHIFFPKEQSRWYLFKFICSGIKGFVKGLLGSILIKIIS